MILQGVGQKTLVALDAHVFEAAPDCCRQEFAGDPGERRRFHPTKDQRGPGEVQFIDCTDFEEVSKQSRSTFADKCSYSVVAAQNLQRCREIDFGSLEDPKIRTLRN